MMLDVQQVGIRIMELRHRRKMTQEQLGQQLGVFGQAVSKWENGDSLPDTALLASLGHALDCSLDYLLGADSTIERLLPMLEAEARGMDARQKIDLAFKLFHLIDPKSYAASTGAAFEQQIEDFGQPYFHAGSDVTVWWKGKMICIASREALQETEDIWNDKHLPFDLFPEAWNSLLTAALTHKTAFNSEEPIAETALRGDGAGTEREAAIHELIDRGLLEKGRGGYRVGLRTVRPASQA